MKRIALVAGLAALTIAGCGNGDDASREDAHDVPGRLIDKSRPHVTAFTNHYPNVESKCDPYGHRIYAMTHDSAQGRNVIIMPDPTCPGYVKGQEPSVTVQGG